MNKLTKKQWLKSMSTGVGDQDHPINQDIENVGQLKVENAEMATSDVTKIIKYSEALQKMFNPSEDLEDWVEAKLNHACDYVATVRDYLKFYNKDQSSIYNEVLKDLIEKSLSKDTSNSNMAMGALKQINNDAKELQSILKPETKLEDWVKAKLNLAGEYLDDVYHHLDHFGPEGRKFDENENINEIDYEGAVGFHELMTFYGKASDQERQQMDDCLANQNVECVKRLVKQVTGMTMDKVAEAVTDPRFLALTKLTPQGLEDYIRNTQKKKKQPSPILVQKAYWISPNGELIVVNSHELWAKERYPKSPDPKLEAFKHGYIRMVYSVHNNGRVEIEFQNIKSPSGELFNKQGNSSLGIPPVKSEVMDVILQFIRDKNNLTSDVTNGNLDEAMSIEENWRNKLGAALAAATMLGAQDVDAATKVKKPAIVTTVKKQGNKIFVNVDEIKTSTASQKYTLKNEGAVRNFYLIGDKPHIGGGHHLDGSVISRSNIRRIASMPNNNPNTNEQLLKYADGGPATAQAFSQVILSNDQISVLFKYDYEDKVEIAKKKYKNFNKFPQLVQTMLVDSIFRGEKHPTTDKLVNSPNPDWNQVADAYVDDEEYRLSKGKGSGVFARMDRNADLVRKAADSEKSIASISKTRNESV